MLPVTCGWCPLVGCVSWKPALRRLVWQDRPIAVSLSLWNAVLGIFPASYGVLCPNCSLRNAAAGKMHQLSPAKLSSAMIDATAQWPLHQSGGLGCFAPDPLFGAVHRVSSGLSCFPGVSKVGKLLWHACVPAVPPPAPGWEQKAGVAVGRHRSRHLAWPWQLGSAVPRWASVSPAWHHRLQPRRASQPAPNWDSAHTGMGCPLQ